MSLQPAEHILPARESTLGLRQEFTDRTGIIRHHIGEDTPTGEYRIIYDQNSKPPIDYNAFLTFSRIDADQMDGFKKGDRVACDVVYEPGENSRVLNLRHADL